MNAPLLINPLFWLAAFAFILLIALISWLLDSARSAPRPPRRGAERGEARTDEGRRTTKLPGGQPVKHFPATCPCAFCVRRRKRLETRLPFAHNPTRFTVERWRSDYAQGYAAAVRERGQLDVDTERKGGR